MKTIMNLKITGAPIPMGEMMVVPFSYLIVTNNEGNISIEERTGGVPNATMQMTFMEAMLQAGAIATANIQ